MFWATLVLKVDKNFKVKGNNTNNEYIQKQTLCALQHMLTDNPAPNVILLNYASLNLEIANFILSELFQN
jgi:hypothetical protein